jgi:aerobic carbon-monoxide dehydrogenase small subunit
MGKEPKNGPVITINGAEYELRAEDLEKKLLDYLRYDLKLTGAKNGCGIGACGACTVVIDGKAKRSCITPVGKVLGSSLLTIEGLAGGGPAAALHPLHPLQQAFIDAGAVQCGFCTPGMIMASYALLLENPSPTRTEIREALEGNLCRCTGYQQIIDAVQLAAARLGLEEL